MTRSRSTRSVVHGVEARVTALIDALRRSGDPTQIDLAGRLWRCQQGRADRRLGIQSAWPPMCRRPACEVCRQWLEKGWRSQAEKRFKDANNESCSLVTIMLARAGSLNDLEQVARDVKTELRNMRDRLARQDRRWRSVEMMGQVETDAMGPSDICLLPPKRRHVVQNLPVSGREFGYVGYDEVVVWVPHIHIVVHAPRLSRGDIRDAVERQWPGPVGRVDVAPFWNGQAGVNAGGVIAYASKHVMRVKFQDNMELDWPLSIQASYWGWLHGLRNGIAPLRVRIGAIKEKTRITLSADSHREILPMPVVI